MIGDLRLFFRPKAKRSMYFYSVPNSRYPAEEDRVRVGREFITRFGDGAPKNAVETSDGLLISAMPEVVPKAECEKLGIIRRYLGPGEDPDS